MIIMNTVCKNVYAFDNLTINYSYPRKLNNSTIENEHLKGFKNFRYKKLNIIMGSNATGKTTYGKLLLNIFNGISKKDTTYFNRIPLMDDSSQGFVEIDFVPNEEDLYRFSMLIIPDHGNLKYKVCVKSTPIWQNDNYETAAKRLSVKQDDYKEDIYTEISGIPHLSWFFIFPSDVNEYNNLYTSGKNYLNILSQVLKTLDPSIDRVFKAPLETTHEKDNTNDEAIVITFHKRKDRVLIYKNDIVHGDVLSSGTKAGIQLASFITAMLEHQNLFYYCDEKFSYIQSDIEKIILTLLALTLKENEQLIFTTHNTDILDLDFPKHSYTFLRRDYYNYQITAIDASYYLKKDTDSLRNAVENDLFGSLPNLDALYSLEDYLNEENHDENE